LVALSLDNSLFKHPHDLERPFFNVDAGMSFSFPQSHLQCQSTVLCPDGLYLKPFWCITVKRPYLFPDKSSIFGAMAQAPFNYFLLLSIIP
jgi:hypothetical protein